MSDALGLRVSQFVKERIDNPHPSEIEIWMQLVYAALFSGGFVVWLETAKSHLSKIASEDWLNKLISEIADDADLWIGAKTREVLQIDSNMVLKSASEIRFHLGAMFNEAVHVMAERGFKPEAARSHACFIHLRANLQQLSLVGKLPTKQVRDVLMQGIEGTDAMAQELTEVLTRKKQQQNTQRRGNRRTVR